MSDASPVNFPGKENPGATAAMYDEAKVQDLKGLAEKYGMDRRAPYYLEKAETFGYCFKGWGMMDYLRNTIIPDPSEREYELGQPKEGFENVITWGRQGTKKSNLNRQMMFSFFYGNGEGVRAEDVWRTVLDNFLMTKAQVYKMHEKTTTENVKLPYVTLDDITTTIPKQLFFIGQSEFIKFQQFVATIRLRIGIFGSNTPLPQNVISVLRDNVSMEVICFPAGSYMTEKYCWFPDQVRPATAYLQKVLIEYCSWNWTAEPEWVYKEYRRLRWEVTEEIVKKLQGKEEEPYSLLPEVSLDELSKAVRVCDLCGCQAARKGVCVCSRHRHRGVKLSNFELRKILDRVMKVLREKATIVNAESTKDVAEVFGLTPEQERERVSEGLEQGEAVAVRDGGPVDGPRVAP